MLLGVDDTDSLEGGCTTHVAVQVALRLKEERGLVLLGPARLVRLNPCNPWKTRGNAALALHLGAPGGTPVKVGEWGGEAIEAFPEGTDVPPGNEVLETAWEVVRDLAWREDGRTNPGLVLSDGPAPEHLYDLALHTLVDMDVLRGRLEERGTPHRAEGTGRGLVGAAAALAWPMERTTWELLAYRPEGRWGTRREVDPASVAAMDRLHPSTFDSIDPSTGVLKMVPSSPCPVLFGIRGTDPEELPRALGEVDSEPWEGWMTFVTNQATDDHLVPKAMAEVAPHESVAVGGRVASAPRTIPGGHVLFDLEEGGARMAVAAYEPTKGFRGVVRRLAPGDRLLACGSVRDEPRTLNLEKFKVMGLGPPSIREKVGNPRCPECGKSMKSVGKGAGYRCNRCGTKATEEEAEHEERPRELGTGWYEVPMAARRHLARPLALGVRPELEAL